MVKHTDSFTLRRYILELFWGDSNLICTFLIKKNVHFSEIELLVLLKMLLQWKDFLEPSLSPILWPQVGIKTV